MGNQNEIHTPNPETEEMILNLRFHLREMGQKLADSEAKLRGSKMEIDRLLKEAPSLKVQRIEGPVRTEIVYEKVPFYSNRANLLTYFIHIRPKALGPSSDPTKQNPDRGTESGPQKRTRRQRTDQPTQLTDPLTQSTHFISSDILQ